MFWTLILSPAFSTRFAGFEGDSLPVLLYLKVVGKRGVCVHARVRMYGHGGACSGKDLAQGLFSFKMSF